MLGTLAATSLASVAFAAAAPAHHKHPVKHRRGCNSTRCDRHADAAYRRHLEKLAAKRRAAGEPMVASYFGGGGGACGGGSWGVASRTLPCGTVLTICSQTCARVPVTDRGPFIAGRDLDLTTEVAEAIGFPMSAGVATVRVSR